jgi:hypothetical protein
VINKPRKKCAAYFFVVRPAYFHMSRHEPKNKKGIVSDALFNVIYNCNPGNALLSHTVTHAVPSAMKSLTSVFGMGTGVSSSLKSPGNFFSVT